MGTPKPSSYKRASTFQSTSVAKSRLGEGGIGWSAELTTWQQQVLRVGQVDLICQNLTL